MVTEDIHISESFKEALDLLENTRDNVFITGKAGTGKSTFLQHFKKVTNKGCAILAPTGVAALNAGGQTIHSFFGFKPRFVDLENIKKSSRKRKLLSQLDLIVIDEISMVRADVFDGIEKMLRLNGPRQGEPFGGVQICVIGDLFQLPPVVNREERDLFKMFYTSPFFFAAQCFKDAHFNIIKFDEIYRQADEDFIHTLNRVRVGDNRSDILQFLNARHGHTFEKTHAHITLCTTNALADDINTQRLEEIHTPTFSFKGKASKDFDLAKGKLPAPINLQLKVGAQIMFTKNDIAGKRWVNGTLGVIQHLDNNQIDVLIDEGVKPQLVSVQKEKWATVRYIVDEENETITEEESGSYEQYPLMLAWAVTIHKSQGKTLEYVEIDLGRGAFVPGQLYVALSRCRKFENIALKRPIRSTDIQCDMDIKRFITSYQAAQKS